MRVLIFIITFFLFTVTALSLAHPHLHFRDSEIDTVDNLAAENVPLVSGGTGSEGSVYGVDKGCLPKRDEEHNGHSDWEQEDYSFRNDFPIGHDDSINMQAHYNGYLSKRDREHGGREDGGYPYWVVDEPGGKHSPKRDISDNDGPENMGAYSPKQGEDHIGEGDNDHPPETNDKGLFKRNCCSGYTEEGIFDLIYCECFWEVEDYYLYETDQGDEEDYCAEKIYNDYKQKHNEEYESSHTPTDHEQAQKDSGDDEENELYLRKTYEDYYQESEGECFQKKPQDPVGRGSGGRVYETEEGQIHKTDDPCYETGRNKSGQACSIGDIHRDSVTKQKLAHSLVEYVCTTTETSPLAVDVAGVAEYFMVVLKRNCRLWAYRWGSCTRIGGIRSASIGICDNYYGWEAQCDDIGKHILELARRCERLVGGVWRAGGRIFHQGWQGNVIVYSML